jgi:Protein of unknown function (DUF3761)
VRLIFKRALIIGAIAGAAATWSHVYACPFGTYWARSGHCVERPDWNRHNVTARCRDGSFSHSEHHSGTCSGHHGVARWYR